MTLEHAILGFLEREPMTGYDLKTRCFDAAAGHVWTADQAQVYRTLERLSERGLVRSRVVPQRGKPDRRIFRITPKGREALLSWLRKPQTVSAVRDPLLVRVFMASDLSDSEISGLLSEAREDYQARLETLRVEAAAPVPSCAARDERGAALYRMTLGAAMSATRAVIDWIDDCAERVSSGLPPASPQVTGEGV
jgi:PadR family transcriptional regulator, regulatory protein AphA